jgi:predicted nucleotidyltransferase
MDLPELSLPPDRRVFIERFVAACRADERVAAAFLGGSYARGAADAYSDLDLYLITTDHACEDFLAGRREFVRSLGRPLFLEDFDTPNGLFFFFASGIEGELWIGRESRFHDLYAGPYSVLLDKKGLLERAVFSRQEPDPAVQIEALRRQVAWFWHDLSHFIKAMGRGQLWFAYGELEVLRQMCVSLARLEHDFSDKEAGQEPYFKLDRAIPIERLAPLKATFCPMEYHAMLQAAAAIVAFYRQIAPPLAAAHDIEYPLELERLMTGRLEALG